MIKFVYYHILVFSNFETTECHYVYSVQCFIKTDKDFIEEKKTDQSHITIICIIHIMNSDILNEIQSM